MAPQHISTALAARRAGVLLHPTSLPAPLGALGSEGRRFIDFLSAAGISVWQMLPVGPTHNDRSPYHSLSANAGNPDLIDLQELVNRGWLRSDDLSDDVSDEYRRFLLKKAADQFFSDRPKDGVDSLPVDYELFLRENEAWLGDYALFQVFRDSRLGEPWQAWPSSIRNREPQALADLKDKFDDEINRIYFEQFTFDQQWQKLRSYARERGVYLFGDIPIFIAHDSADVWSHRSLFKLDEKGAPRVVAGVPPDYFSSRGQHWGNPLYNWDAMEADGFQWWLTRLGVQQKLFDLIRIDHFRGLVACWEIPAQASEPSFGQWVDVPGHSFLQSCFRAFPDLPLVAENLGLIGEDVEQLRLSFSLPGMAVLQFGFDGSANNPHLNHNHSPGDVIYTGTHDNDTTLGWYISLDDRTRTHVDEYIGWSSEPMPWKLMGLAMQSVSRLAIIPIQDALGLDSAARLNTPGTVQGNWCWKMQWNQIDESVIKHLRHLVSLYGRLP